MSEPSSPGLTVDGLELRWTPGAPPAVRIPELTLTPGERVALTGPSGSGKTTLVHLLCGLLVPSGGRIRWADDELAAMSEPQRDRWRRHRVGIVFQDFHLVPGLSALRNVLVSCWFEGWSAPAELTARARELLRRLAVPGDARPVETLSRGEQQRVALARALLRRPGILVADEPTASLDEATGERIIADLLEAAAEQRATTLVVTHDRRLVRALDREIALEAGRIVATR